MSLRLTTIALALVSVASASASASASIASAAASVLKNTQQLKTSRELRAATTGGHYAAPLRAFMSTGTFHSDDTSASTLMASHLDVMSEGMRKRALTAECQASYDALNGLIGDAGSCRSLFVTLEANTSLVAKAAAAEAYCEGTCPAQLLNATRDVLACPLDNATVVAAVEAFVSIVRDAIGVICLQDDADKYCFPLWANFSTDIQALEGTDNFTALSALPPVYCQPCLYKFFKHMIEFAKARPGETQEEYDERLKVAVGLRLFCSKSLVNTSAFCLNELEQFRVSLTATAATLNATNISDANVNLTAVGAALNETFDALCSESGCIQRWILAHEYFADDADGAAGANAGLNAIRTACVRDANNNLCLKVGFATFLDFANDGLSLPAALRAGADSDLWKNHPFNGYKRSDARPADSVQEGFSYPDECPAESNIRATMKEFNDRMGCCATLFFDTFPRTDDKKTPAERDAEIAKNGRFLSYIAASCDQTLAEPCTQSAVDFSVTFSNINATYFTANRDAILLAMEEDLAANSGANEQEATANATIATARKRAAGDVSASLATGPVYTATQAAAIAAGLFAGNGDTYTNGKLAGSVADAGRVDPLAVFATSGATATVSSEALPDPFANITREGSAATPTATGGVSVLAAATAAAAMMLRM